MTEQEIQSKYKIVGNRKFPQNKNRKFSKGDFT